MKPKHPNFPPKIKIPKNGKHPCMDLSDHIWEDRNRKTIRVQSRTQPVRKD